LRFIGLVLITFLVSSGVVAKSPKAKVLPEIEQGWKRQAAYRETVGAYDYLRDGVFVKDMRTLEPEKALKACRALGSGDQDKWLNGLGCLLFTYPANDNLPQAAEARDIYEQQFAGARTPAERVSMALDKRMGEMRELAKNASPAVLNSFVNNGSNGEVATLAEKVIFQDRTNAPLLQWLYDRGARLCMIEAPPGQRRFSCIQIYLQAHQIRQKMEDGSWSNQPAIDVLDTLERNGFRPQTASELKSAANWMDVQGSNEPHKARYYALISPTNRRSVDRMAVDIKRDRDQKYAAEVAKQQRAEQDELRGAVAAPRHSAASNQLAVRRLGQKGQAVCQFIQIDGATHIFRANVEGTGQTRLQLRMGSIRGKGSDVLSFRYGDTTVSPGLVFWDDAANWQSDC
jgi:hypothetical protein